MNTDGFKRRLSAILSADVAGYSRLMGADDQATVRTLTGHRQLMSTIIETHHGRVVDSPGDNLLAEFESVIQCVECAVEVQHELAGRNAQLPENTRLIYRIGVNIGDVIKEGDRIYGDGVNIAARLESLAEPGGICISGNVYTHVKNKLKLEYEFLGKQTVKNISEPIPVYRIISLAPPTHPIDGENNQLPRLSDKPSIAVLPFVNISGDAEQEYFSDGMTEELINALANIEGLKVISRTSSFFFKGKDVDLRTIGQKLTVAHVIEGSVRKAGNRLRITAQLIRVSDDSHLWSQTYDREIEDIFAIQEEIAGAIADKFKVQVLGKSSQPPHIDAYESFIKGRYHYHSFAEGGMQRALQYYQQATVLDPGYAPAYSSIAEWHWAVRFIDPAVSSQDAYRKARAAMDMAMTLDNSLPEAHATLGLIRWIYEWDWKGAEQAFEKAIALNPGLSKPHYDYAFFLAAGVGNAQKSLAESRKALSLDPLSGNAHYCFGLGLLKSGQLDQAIEVLQSMRHTMPMHPPSLLALVQALKEKGLLAQAVQELEKGLTLFPHHPALLSQMGAFYALMGKEKKTRAILDELIGRSQQGDMLLTPIAMLHAALNETQAAFQWLEKAYERRDVFLPMIDYIGLPNILRDHPQYKTLLEKMRSGR